MVTGKTGGLPVDNRGVRELVGPLPTGAGDREAAQQYVDRISRVIEHETLSLPERRALYKLRAKWRKRADGFDHRWSVVGTTAGRPRAVKQVVRDGLTREELDDPLLRTIESKFGKGRASE